MRLALACLALVVALAARGSDSTGTPDPYGLLSVRERRQLVDALQGARSVGTRNPHDSTDPRPTYADLPETLSPKLPEDEGFVSFKGMTDSDDVPLGDDWTFEPPKELEQLIEEDAWALLPKGRTIARTKDAQGREVWDYPAGTKLVHRLYFKAAPKPVFFEARFMAKRGDGKWSMGLYYPEGALKPLEETGGLRLNTEAGAQTRFEIQLATETVKVQVKRLKPDSCRHCHWAMGHGDYQYPDVDHAGPCGFVPPNARVATEWAKAYEKRYGSSPFAADPGK